MPRTISVAVTVALAIATAGCGGDDDSGGDGGSGSEPARLVVSAASSMTKALEECAPRFGDQENADVKLSFAGSDELAAQIRQGGKPDVFAAANTKLPKALHAEGKLSAPQGFASNELVEKFDDVFSGRSDTDVDRQELETLAAAVKPLTTWHALDTLQEAREACGGAGFLAENRVAQMRADLDVYVTFEGDNTVLLQLVGKRRQVDVALMPIGGHFTMDRIDAVDAADFVGAKVVIPCHYNTFPLIETDAQAFKADVEQAGIAQVAVLDPGQEHSL